MDLTLVSYKKEVQKNLRTTKHDSYFYRYNLYPLCKIMILEGTKIIKSSFQVKFEKRLRYIQSSKSQDTPLNNGSVFRNASNCILSFLKRLLFCFILRIHYFIESTLVQKHVQFILYYNTGKWGILKGKQWSLYASSFWKIFISDKIAV